MITTVSGIQPPYCWPAPGDTALLAAARHGLEDAVLFLLDIPNIRTDNCSRSTVGESALHLAIESGLANAAYRLAKLGACPNTLRFSASHPEPPSVEQPVEDRFSVAKAKMASPVWDRLPTLPTKQTMNPFGDCSDSEESQEIEGEAEKRSNRLDVILDRRERGNADGDSKESLTGLVHMSVEADRTSKRESPLHLAVRLSMHKLIYLYIQEGGVKGVKCPDWFTVNESGDTVFGLALMNYDSGLAEDLLSAALAQLARVKTDHNEAPSPRDVFDKMTNEMIKIRPQAFGLLQRTIESGSLEGVKFLLKYSIEVNPRFPILTTPTRAPLTSSLTTESLVWDVVHLPLWMALAAHRTDMASILVGHGADVDSWSELSSTGVSLSLLHRAILCGMDDAASFLIDSGCDFLSPLRLSKPAKIPANDQYRFLEDQPTALHLAASVGLPGILSKLLAIPGVDVNAKDDLGRTPLHLAVEENRLHAMEVLLNDSRANLRAHDNRGFTAFRVAMDRHHLTAARSLQQKDSSISLECDNTGRNVLHSSVQTGDRNAIFFLIQIGADMNAPVRDLEALTPLHIGITAGIPEDVLRSMILAGASVSAVTKQKQTGLHLAVLHNQPMLLRCLLENGAPPNAQDTECNTEVTDAIRRLRNNKAPGEDGIPSEVYKYCVDTGAAFVPAILPTSGGSGSGFPSSMTCDLYSSVVRSIHPVLRTPCPLHPVDYTLVWSVPNDLYEQESGLRERSFSSWDGQQPLHVLAQHTHTEEGIRDCFFDRRPDVDVNAVDAAGNTPLMLAFAAKNTDFCIYLLGKGASLGNVNLDNWSIFAGGIPSPDFLQLKQILGAIIFIVFRQPPLNLYVGKS
ncbi:unnamed protein product [Schistocephalus solidus]|uniref:ANK_REP_REGION domain-containing protein n=1 Tax=Schistocephalus solidus TaxID=70667 RepID=A0A183SWI9_SCHSO|nr:unnamed protein product [Schistocephalus solidus]